MQPSRRKTPLERTAKQAVKDILDPLKPNLYYTMPVPSGYGESQLDFVGCYYGFFFTVETKRDMKGNPTGPQEGVIERVRNAHGKAFVVRGADDTDELTEWLDAIRIGMGL